MAATFFKSIRFKALCWYTVFLLFILSAFSVLIYESFKKTIYDDLDDLLSAKADGICDTINAYWQAKRVAVSGQSTEDEFVKAAAAWVEVKRKDPQLMGVFVQILNTKGEVLVASRATPRGVALTKEDFDDVLKGDDSFDTVNGGSGPAPRQVKYRMYTKPASEENETRYVVQVFAPAELLSMALHNLRLVLFLLLPLTIILAAIPGVILVRLTLRPVDKMVDTLRQITTENLKLKIHIPDTKDEVKKLADTFNDMIERLDRSFSSQQGFIQDISAGLKEPVRVLREEIGKALERPCREDGHTEILDRMRGETENFLKVIEDLEALGRFDNSRTVLEIRKVNLTRLLESVLDDMKEKAQEKDIAVSFSCPKTITLDGDEEQLKRLITNILDNAVKYTYRKGSVTVLARKDNKTARIHISDTGIGIPEDELDYIFNRFYRVSKSRGVNHGFGLGLSRAKAIAEAHRGAIAAESRYGKGSTFTITLPLSYQG